MSLNASSLLEMCAVTSPGRSVKLTRAIVTHKQNETRAMCDVRCAMCDVICVSRVRHTFHRKLAGSWPGE